MHKVLGIKDHLVQHGRVGGKSRRTVAFFCQLLDLHHRSGRTLHSTLIYQQGSQQNKLIGLPVYWKAELMWCLEEVMI
jgi:hypothetical protein